MDSRRLDAARERLTSLPENLVRVVVTHHPTIASVERPGMVLVGNARRTLNMLTALDVRLVLSGHAHRSYSRMAVGGGPLVVQCATTTSVRLRGEPNSYNRITINRSGKIGVEVRVWTGDGWAVQGAPKSR
jgi:3',5'-cyclic AMP phosphodiesterase CpdA